MSQGTDTPEQLKERIELTRNSFGGAKNTNITGVIVNKLNAPVDEQGRTRPICPRFSTTLPKLK
ncbi:phosphate acetyltransferase [Escherichia coli]|nr:phosphate acetyltransferase [Escherichia coli]